MRGNNRGAINRLGQPRMARGGGRGFIHQRHPPYMPNRFQQVGFNFYLSQNIIKNLFLFLIFVHFVLIYIFFSPNIVQLFVAWKFCISTLFLEA